MILLKSLEYLGSTKVKAEDTVGLRTVLSQSSSDITIGLAIQPHDFIIVLPFQIVCCILAIFFTIIKKFIFRKAIISNMTIDEEFYLVVHSEHILANRNI